MKRMKNVGLVLCGTVLGLALSAPAAQAVESLKAMLSANRIFVDRQEVQIEAYTIHDNNFMQLRDIGKAVGFNVYWDTNTKTVQIETGKPYTGEAPAKDEAADSAPQPEVTSSAGDADAMKQDIVDRTNALRKENGVAALCVNDKLMQAAQVRADEMAAHTVYSHTRPNGEKFNTVTDCPYMAPEPVRGIRCDSSLIRYVGEYVASVKGISPEEVFRQTAQNAKAVYQL